MILEYLNKDNLHHAYLIEGEREVVVPEILQFVQSLGVKTVGNPDFFHISADSFKIDDARNIKSFGSERGITSAKKIFLISTNQMLLEAQNSLLKMFEEPIKDTHFFLVVPDTNALLRTLVSRFYVLDTKQLGQGSSRRDSDEIETQNKVEDAGKFITMNLRSRLEYVKNLVAKASDDEEDITLDSARSKALSFLNALEQELHNKAMSKTVFDIGGRVDFFEHIFSVRKFLRMPGSSPKTLLESVALVVPNL